MIYVYGLNPERGEGREEGKEGEEGGREGDESTWE